MNIAEEARRINAEYKAAMKKLREETSERIGASVLDFYFDAAAVSAHVFDDEFVANLPGATFIRRHSEVYPWEVSATVDGVTYFSLVTDKRKRELEERNV